MRIITDGHGSTKRVWCRALWIAEPNVCLGFEARKSHRSLTAKAAKAAKLAKGVAKAIALLTHRTIAVSREMIRANLQRGSGSNWGYLAELSWT